MESSVSTLEMDGEGVSQKRSRGIIIFALIFTVYAPKLCLTPTVHSHYHRHDHHA
jgi:hypothetical protein